MGIIWPRPSDWHLTLLVAVLPLVVGAVSTRADDIRVFSGGAPQGALRIITPQFEQATGHRVQYTFALVTAIQKKLADGEKPDLILLPVPLIAATEKTVPLRTEGRNVLARVGISIIVREGATRPEVTTPDAVRNLLLSAKSIALPPQNTPGGGHLMRVLGELGIADTVHHKLVVKAAIDGGAELVASGQAEVGMYLASEVQSAKGIEMVGLLPTPLQSFVVYGAAVPVYNNTPEPAVTFIKFLSDPARASVWKAAGFELVEPGSASR